MYYGNGEQPVAPRVLVVVYVMAVPAFATTLCTAAVPGLAPPSSVPFPLKETLPPLTVVTVPPGAVKDHVDVVLLLFAEQLAPTVLTTIGSVR